MSISARLGEDEIATYGEKCERLEDCGNLYGKMAHLCAKDLTFAEKSGLYAATRSLTTELLEFVEEEFNSDSYARDKIRKASFSICAALGFDIDNGHDPEWHSVQALGYIQILEGMLSEKFGEE